MKSKISGLMDGELERHEANGALDALKAEGEARDTWRDYHLIRDSMSGEPQLSAGFAALVAARLAEEPTVLAPRAKPMLGQRRWQALSAAASFAAVAFVAFTYFSQDPTGAVPPAASTATQIETVKVAPPDAADDYVLAHQGYSPRNSLQGAASYVRTVSSDMGAIRK